MNKPALDFRISRLHPHVAFLVLLTSLLTGLAQSVDAEVPLIRAVPEGSSWTIRILPHRSRSRGPTGSPNEPRIGEDDSVSAAELRRVTNEYANGVRKVVFQHRDGKTETFYLAKNCVFSLHPKSGEPEVMSPEDAFIQGLPYNSSSFEEFHWINKSNFVGERSYRGVLCDVYQQTLYDAPRGMFDLPEGVTLRGDSPASTAPYPEEIARRLKKQVFRTAYINKLTRLPVALEDDVGMRVYDFSVLSTPPQLPEIFSKALHDVLKKRERAAKIYTIPQ
jgi:hypothetical protein